MKIRAIDAIPLGARLRDVFQFGHVDRRAGQNVLVRLETDDGLIGWGEACPVPGFTAETQVSVLEAIEQLVAPALIGRDPLDREPLVRELELRLPHRNFTLAAVDIALWDLAGKACGQPIAALLGGRYRDRVDLHGSVGWGEPEVMAETARAQLQHGYTTLKLYAGRGSLSDDLDRLWAVRDAVPEQIRFLLDVNGLWSLGQCRAALPVLRELRVALLEQPLPAWDMAAQATLCAESPIDVAADEAVRGPHDVVAVSRYRSAHVINLGVSKLGGLLRARECALVAEATGLSVTVGSVLELGVGNAAGLHLAAAIRTPVQPSYLVGPLKYERDVVVDPLVVTDGTTPVPDGPGLGIDIDKTAVAAMDLRNR